MGEGKADRSLFCFFCENRSVYGGLFFQGSLRADLALSTLASFEAKFQRIKEERRNVAKAMEALELPESGNQICVTCTLVLRTLLFRLVR